MTTFKIFEGDVASAMSPTSAQTNYAEVRVLGPLSTVVHAGPPLNSIGNNWERFQLMSWALCHGVIYTPIKSAKNYSPKNSLLDRPPVGWDQAAAQSLIIFLSMVFLSLADN